MTEKYDFALSKKAKHGFASRKITREEWEKLKDYYPEMPTTFDALKEFTYKVFGKDQAMPAEDNISGTGWLELFGHAIDNPDLTVDELKQIDTILTENLPSLDKTTENAYFIIFWTDSDSDPSNNTTQEVVNDILDILTSTLLKYNEIYGRMPYIPKGYTAIPVSIYNISRGFGSTSLEGPLNLKASTMNALPAMRTVTAPHELFHRMQYSFGMKSQFNLPAGQSWFVEGCATWAGLYFSGGYVAGNSRITTTFNDPGRSFLYDGAYDTTPMWIYLQGYKGTGMTKLLLENLEHIQDANAALTQTLLSIDESEFPGFFMNSFFAAMCGQAWNSEGNQDLPRKNGALLYDPIFSALTGQQVSASMYYNASESFATSDSFTWNNVSLNAGGSALYLIEVPTINDTNYISMEVNTGAPDQLVCAGIFYLLQSGDTTNNTGSFRDGTPGNELRLGTPLLSNMGGESLLNAIAVVITNNDVFSSGPGIEFNLTVTLGA